MKKVLVVYNPFSGNRYVPKQLDYIVTRFIENDTIAIPFRLGRDNSSCREISGRKALMLLSCREGTEQSIRSPPASR